MGKIDWKSIVGTVAPSVATALGGPLAGVAVKAIAGKVLGKADATEEEVEAAVAGADPNTLIKLKELDVEFKKSMSDAGIQLERIAADDRNSAREREKVIRDRTPAQLAWMIIGGFLFVTLAQLIGLVAWAEEVKKIPPEGWLLIGNVSGYLANEAKQAAAYYFGSTVGSKDKDDTISTIAKME